MKGAPVNQGGQDQGHSHRRPDKPRRQFHKDWRVWVGVVLILVALAAYVLTNDETLRPGRAPQQPVPAAPIP